MSASRSSHLHARKNTSYMHAHARPRTHTPSPSAAWQPAYVLDAPLALDRASSRKSVDPAGRPRPTICHVPSTVALTVPSCAKLGLRTRLWHSVWVSSDSRQCGSSSCWLTECWGMSSVWHALPPCVHFTSCMHRCHRKIQSQSKSEFLCYGQRAVPPRFVGGTSRTGEQQQRSKDLQEAKLG